MNPQIKEQNSPIKKEQAEGTIQQKYKIDLFLSSQNVLKRYHRAEMAYINLIDLLSKEQQPQNDLQYRTCINYLQALTLSSINEVTPQKDFLKQLYDQQSLNEKKEELLQYYKFHKNVGLVISKPIQNILQEYHIGRRKQEYKNIKKMLKAQHDISIKSYQQDSSQSACTPSRSHYSNFLSFSSKEKSPLKSSQQSQPQSDLHEQKGEIFNESVTFSKMCKGFQSQKPSSLNIDKLAQKLRKKQFYSDLKLKNDLAKIKTTPKIIPKNMQSSRVKVVISQSKIFPKTLLQSQSLRQQTKVNTNSSIFNKLVSMQSQMEMKGIKFSSKMKHKNKQKDHYKTVDFRSKSIKMNQSSKSLHRKKSDIFLPTSMPQINCYLINSQASLCSSLSFNSKDGQQRHKKQKCFNTLDHSFKSKKHAQILFQKLKLHP